MTPDALHEAPQLVIGLNVHSIERLPAFSAGPRALDDGGLRQIRAAGFAGLQDFTPCAARAAGLHAFGFGRIDVVDDADRIARAHRDDGFEATTLHVGTGLESDDAAVALTDAVVEASVRHGYPLFIETHRATITQDMKRTLDLIGRRPEIRFNVDFSHYYTGAEMTYGDIREKLARLQPLFERTGFIHGRVSDPGCAQISILDERCAPHRAAFLAVWRTIFRYFRSTAPAGALFGFCPEILGPWHHYARTRLEEDGTEHELTDRWAEAVATAALGRSAWDDVSARADVSA